MVTAYASLRTRYDLYCPYFLPDVMVKFTRKAKGHFVTLIEVGMHLIERNRGHIKLLVVRYANV